MKFKSNFLETLGHLLSILGFQEPFGVSYTTEHWGVSSSSFSSQCTVARIQISWDVWILFSWLKDDFIFFPFSTAILIRGHRLPHTRVELLFSAQDTISNFRMPHHSPPILWYFVERSLHLGSSIAVICFARASLLPNSILRYTAAVWRSRKVIKWKY